MVLFCDVVGFTSMSKEVEPSEVMNFLNELYEIFDNLSDDYNMYKLDIVGDCYIVVAGLIKEDQDGFVCVDDLDEDQVASNAIRIMQFAKAMLRQSKPILMPHNQSPVQIRIGIHTGPLVSGLVGSKMPKFTLFGDTMNTASRMESTCKPGCIQVSDAFKSLVPHEEWEPTGGVQVKGKGLMETFIYTPSKKQELLDLEGVTAKSPSRKNLDKSFTSNNSAKVSSSSPHHDFDHPVLTIMILFMQTRSRGSDSGRSHAAGHKNHENTHNPLMTILTNLRGGVDDDDNPDRTITGHSDGRSRPKSAFHKTSRKSMAVYKYQRDSTFPVPEDVEEVNRRSGLSETINETEGVRRSGGNPSQLLLSMLPGGSFKTADGTAGATNTTLSRAKSNRNSRSSKPLSTTFATPGVIFPSRPPGSMLDTVYDNTSSKGGTDARSSKDARSSQGARSSVQSLPSARSMGSMTKIVENKREGSMLAIETEVDENGNEVLLLS